MATLTYETFATNIQEFVAPTAGIDVPNASGAIARCSAELLALYAAASIEHGVPLALLLVQGCQESSFRPDVVSPDGGYGASQWTYPPVARYYLGVPDGEDWHPAALDPARAIPAQAWFDHDLFVEGGSWHQCLARYNGGTNGESIPAAASYASGILTHAQALEARLDAMHLAPTLPPPGEPVERRGTVVKACALKITASHASKVVAKIPAGAGIAIEPQRQTVHGQEWALVHFGEHGILHVGWVLAANVAPTA